MSIDKLWIKISKFSLVFFLILAWIFSGWPQIFNFPPKIQEARAAQVAIDTTVSTAVAEHSGSSPTTVFISDQVGYAFYVNSGGEASYSKTTDGGANWGTAVTVDAQTDVASIAVWYDRWTPGDNTGTKIHIATIDSGVDDIWYREFDTADDTFGNTIFNISDNAAYAGTLAAGTNYVSITKDTAGALYAATLDGADSIVMRCASACTTDANWSEDSPAFTLGNDPPILLPLLGGDIMLIQWDISADDIQSKVRDDVNGWDASWTNIELNAGDNTTYDAAFGAVVDRATGDVYLAFADDIGTLGGSDDDIKTFLYSGGIWTAKTDVVTNGACAGVANCGITGAKIAFDENTGDVYVVYSAQTTPGTADTAEVRWKKSTDGMTSWSAESAAVNTAGQDDIYGARLNLMSNERIFTTWYEATEDDLYGDTIADLWVWEQSAYRLFNNTDSTDVGAALAAQDTAATLGAAGAAFRLRMLLHNTGQAPVSGENLKLQFAQQSGTCDTGFAGETYADVTAATVIAYNDNATPADGAALTANANDPTHSTDLIVNQTYEELNNFTNSVAAIPSGQDGKWDFSLIDNGSTADTAYCFRAVKSDGTLLNTYTVIPQITTAAAAASLTFTVSTDNFPTLTPGTARFATTTLNVNTNNSTGWNVTLSRDDPDTTMDLDTDAAVNITDQTEWIPGAATTTAGNAVRISSFINSGDVLSFRVMSASGTQAFISTTWWGTTDSYIDSATTLWAGIASSTAANLKIGNSSVSCSGANCALNTVLYYLDVASTQKTGVYSGGITYTATMNP